MAARPHGFTSDGLLAVGASRYHGFAVRETTGTDPAVVRVREASGAGELLDTISLLPGESLGAWYQTGMVIRGGVYVDVVSGAVEGTIRAA